MNDNDILLLLLQIVRINGNTMHLFSLGISMVRVSQMIDDLKKSGCVISKNDQLSLTEKGYRLFHNLNHQLRRRGMYRYISPDWINKDSRAPLDTVYIPIKKKSRGGRKQNL